MYFIVHLNQIYNSYSQTKEEKKQKQKTKKYVSKQDIVSNTAVPSL